MPAVEQRGDFAEEEGVKVAHLGEAPPGQAVVSGAPSQDDDRIAELIPPPPLDVPLDAVITERGFYRASRPAHPEPRSA